MPPKKKQRTSGSNQKADQPTTMDHVPPVLQKLKDWLGKAYELRHGSDVEHPTPLTKVAASCRFARGAGIIRRSLQRSVLSS